MEGEVPGGKRKLTSSDNEGDSTKAKIPKLEDKRNLCPVCLENMDPNEVLATPCAHMFHPHCILTSFEYTDKCPICRFRMDELAGYPYGGPVHPEPVRNDRTTHPRSPRSNQRQRANRGRRAHNQTPRARRAPTPYPAGEAAPGPVPTPEAAPESAPSEPTIPLEETPSSSSSRDIQLNESTLYHGEYTPNVTSEDDDDETDDPNDPDYVPSVVLSIDSVAVSIDNMILEALSHGEDSEASSSDARYALNESPDAPPTEESEESLEDEAF